MTLAMPDSIIPENLPKGYGQYLGYTDGSWPTAARLRSMFPGARVLSLTVRGGSAVADGCDIEAGDLTPATGARWLHGRIAAGAVRPVGYASVSTIPAVISELAKLGVKRSQVRILTAHYGKGEHVCGPRTCKALSFAADGTQWTNQFRGNNGALIDMSALAGDFFGATAPQPPDWEDALIMTIPTIKQGSSGQAVWNWQGLLVARKYRLGATGPSGDGVDGAFGNATHSATIAFQKAHGLAQDGEVGQKTWTAALSA